MTDETESLVLSMLRSIRSEIALIRADVTEVNARITNLESGQAVLQQSIGHYAATLAQTQLSIDR